MQQPGVPTPTIRRLGTLAATAVALGLSALALALFRLLKLLDWGFGAWRALLVAALAALALAALGLRRRIALAASTASRALLAGLAALALLVGVATGVDSVLRTRRTDTILLDQGQNAYRALRYLVEGRNPYGRHAMLEGTVLRMLWDELLLERPECRALADPTDPPVELIERYWSTLDADLVPRILPEIKDTAACADLARRFQTLGLKYGPLLLALYAPFIALAGKSGVYLCHPLFFGGLAALIALTTRRWSGRGALAPAVALLVFAACVHVRYNTLHLSTHDLVALFFALAFLELAERGRPRAACLLLGASLSVKLLPALLYLPLTLSLPRRARPWVLALPLACWLPFAAADPASFYGNVFAWYFWRLPGDSTGLGHFLAPPVARGLQLVGAAVLAATLVHFARSGWTSSRKLAFLALAHGVVLAAGPYLHNNYLVWLAAVVALCLGYGLAGRATAS